MINLHKLPRKEKKAFKKRALKLLRFGKVRMKPFIITEVLFRRLQALPGSIYPNTVELRLKLRDKLNGFVGSNMVI